MVNEIDVRPTAVPDGLLEKLGGKHRRYTDPKSLYFCVWLWDELLCGVFGDGANGAYEWLPKHRNLGTRIPGAMALDGSTRAGGFWFRRAMPDAPFGGSRCLLRTRPDQCQPRHYGLG